MIEVQPHLPPEFIWIFIVSMILFAGGCVALLVNLVALLFRIVIYFFFPNLRPPTEEERQMKFVLENLDKINDIYRKRGEG